MFFALFSFDISFGINLHCQILCQALLILTINKQKNWYTYNRCAGCTLCNSHVIDAICTVDTVEAVDIVGTVSNGPFIMDLRDTSPSKKCQYYTISL